MTKESLEQLLVDYGVSFTSALADRLLQEFNPGICEDAISRQAVLEKIHWLGLDNDTAIKCDLAIRALSSVNPQEPKTGHWQDLTGLFFCSECDGGFHKPWRYCPNCGAKMIAPQESEDKCRNCEYSRNPDYTRCHECKAESEEA